MKLIFTTILVLSCFALTTVSQALAPKPAPQQKQEVVYHNANIHVGNGQVLKGASLIFSNGKITGVGYFKRAWQKTDIDLKGQHIYPGFILPISEVGLTEVNAVKATRDSSETGDMNPNIRSIIAYNTDSEIIPTFKFNGVLLAQTTPKGGLVSGLSSVVQLDAWNWEDAVVKLDDALHVNWPNATKNRFDFSTFTLKTEKNKDYDDQIKKITGLFHDAKALSQQASGGDQNLKLKAVVPAITGQRQVFIHTQSPKSIVESVNFFNKIGVRNVVLVVDQNAEPVIGFIKDSGVPVIVRSVHSLPKRKDSSVDAGYDIAVKLHKAGILVSLAYNASSGVMSSRNLPFTAGTLVNYGLDKEQALQMITENSAKILGIDDQYGTLAVGKSATLFVTKGDALDMRGNILSAAYIDGRKLELEGRQQKLYKRYKEKYHTKKTAQTYSKATKSK